MQHDTIIILLLVPDIDLNQEWLTVASVILVIFTKKYFTYRIADIR